MSKDKATSSPYATLGLQPTFNIDSAQLEQAYFQLQNVWHPDRFAHKNPAEQVTAALKSAEINEAYRCLKDPLESLWAFVASQGLQIQRQDNISDNPKLVEHIFELQDELSECTTPEAQQNFFDKVNHKINQAKDQLSAALASNDNETIHHNLYYLTYLYKIQKSYTI